MFNFFGRPSNDTASNDNTNKAADPKQDAPTANQVASPLQPTSTAAPAPEKVDDQQNSSPVSRPSPSEAQWYTCLDFVRVDGSQTTPINAKEVQGTGSTTEATQANAPTLASPTVASPSAKEEEAGAALPEANTEESDFNDAEWQEVTMTAFRGDASPQPAAIQHSQPPKNDSSSDSSSSSGSDDDEKIQSLEPSNIIVAPPSEPEPHVDGPNTILNIRAREQRKKEDQKKAELEALGRATDEQRNLLAAKALFEAEEENQRRLKAEREARAAEQARAVAAALEEEEKSQRERSLQAAQAAAQTAAGPSMGSPARQCDCLGATSGFHRQGCKLRK